MPSFQEILDEFKHLLADHTAATNQMVEQRLTKGVADPESREKVARIEADIARFNSDLTALAERSSRPPGALNGDGPPETKSLGQLATEAPDYKNCTFSGKFRLNFTVNTSIATMNRKFITGANWPLQPYHVGLVATPLTPLTVRRLLTTTSISGTNAIDYVKEDWTLPAGPPPGIADYQIAYGDKKVEGGVTWTPATASVVTIAWFVKVPRQVAADIPQIMTAIDNRLRYGVLMREDRELLYGAGGAGKILGIMPQATAATAAGAGDTALDQLLSAITQVYVNGYIPTDIVMHPGNWADVIGLKNTQGTYIYGGPPVGMPPNTAWGLPVTVSPNVTAGEFLVGAFPTGAELFDRETVTVDVAYENEDDFVRNLITIRAEERIAFAVYATKAFVKGTLVAPALARGGGETGEANKTKK